MTIDLEGLHNTATEYLDRLGVFDIDHYGWLNEDDVEPRRTASPPNRHGFNAS